MKKVTVLASLLSVVAAPIVMAQAPHYELIRFECPHATGGVASERLVNTGSEITGMGEENIGTYKTKPVFSGALKL